MTVHPHHLAFPPNRPAGNADLQQAMRAFPGFRPLFEPQGALAADVAAGPYDSVRIQGLIRDWVQSQGYSLGPWKEDRLRHYPPPWGHEGDTLAARLDAAQMTDTAHFPKLSHPDLKSEIVAWLRSVHDMRTLADLLGQHPGSVMHSCTADWTCWISRRSDFVVSEPTAWEDGVLLLPLLATASGETPWDMRMNATKDTLLQRLDPLAFAKAVSTFNSDAATFRNIGRDLDFVEAHVHKRFRHWTPPFKPTEVVLGRGTAKVLPLCSAEELADAFDLLDIYRSLIPALIDRALGHHYLLLGGGPDPESDSFFSLLRLSSRRDSVLHVTAHMGQGGVQPDDPLHVEAANVIPHLLRWCATPLLPVTDLTTPLRTIVDADNARMRADFCDLIAAYWPDRKHSVWNLIAEAAP